MVKKQLEFHKISSSMNVCCIHNITADLERSQNHNSFPWREFQAPSPLPVHSMKRYAIGSEMQRSYNNFMTKIPSGTAHNKTSSALVWTLRLVFSFHIRVKVVRPMQLLIFKSWLLLLLRRYRYSEAYSSQMYPHQGCVSCTIGYNNCAGGSVGSWWTCGSKHSLVTVQLQPVESKPLNCTTSEQTEFICLYNS